MEVDFGKPSSGVTQMEELLNRSRDAIVEKWVTNLSLLSETYRRRPRYELASDVRGIFNSKLVFIFKEDPLPLRGYIERLWARGRSQGVPAAEFRRAFELFRTVARPFLIEKIALGYLDRCLGLLDVCVCFSADRINELILADARGKTEGSQELAANLLKEQFLANISHELKTPLTSIIGFSKILLEKGEEVSSTAAKEKLRIIHEQGKCLLRLVDILLLISEINSGTVRLSKDPVDLKDLVHLAIQNVKRSRIAEEHSIHFNFGQDIPVIIGDSEKLSAVAYELIYNGLKFSLPKGNVEIECHRSEDNVVLSVKDHGIGIETSELEAVFAPFYQQDGSITRKHGGSGLGLTMVRRVVELHSGTVKVESSPNAGTTFTIELPLVPQI